MKSGSLSNKRGKAKKWLFTIDVVCLGGVFYFEEEEEGPIEEVFTKDMSIMHWEGVVRQQVTLTIDSF